MAKPDDVGGPLRWWHFLANLGIPFLLRREPDEEPADDKDQS